MSVPWRESPEEHSKNKTIVALVFVVVAESSLLAAYKHALPGRVVNSTLTTWQCSAPRPLDWL